MKAILIFVSFLIVFMTFTTETKATQDSCKWYCEEIDWMPYNEYVEFEYMGCTWILTYVSRIADCYEPMFCDFLTKKIELKSFMCQPTGYVDPYQLFQLGQIALLEAVEGSECEPDNGECSTQYGAHYSSCWKWGGPLPGPGGGTMPPLIPCEVTGCCVDFYRVCKDQQGQRTVTLMSNDGGGVCEGGECFNICESMH